MADHVDAMVSLLRRALAIMNELKYEAFVAEIDAALAMFPMTEPDPTTTITPPDRSWWSTIYSDGIKADWSKQPRTPPDGLTDDQREVWLSGYDR